MQVLPFQVHRHSIMENDVAAKFQTPYCIQITIPSLLWITPIIERNTWWLQPIYVLSEGFTSNQAQVPLRWHIPVSNISSFLFLPFKNIPLPSAVFSFIIYTVSMLTLYPDNWPFMSLHIGLWQRGTLTSLGAAGKSCSVKHKQCLLQSSASGVPRPASPEANLLRDVLASRDRFNLGSHRQPASRHWRSGAVYVTQCLLPYLPASSVTILFMSRVWTRCTTSEASTVQKNEWRSFIACHLSYREGGAQSPTLFSPKVFFYYLAPKDFVWHICLPDFSLPLTKYFIGFLLCVPFPRSLENLRLC